MLMKIPKETNYSNQRTSNYFSEEQKTDYTFSSNKYSTATPVRGKFIKQLEEYSCEPDETIKMFKNYNNESNNNIVQKSTIRAHGRDFTQLEESKEFEYPGLKLLHLKKIPSCQLELNPSVDSTPRDITVTGMSLTSSMSSIFLSPNKFERVCQNKLGQQIKYSTLAQTPDICKYITQSWKLMNTNSKIRDKVLKSNSEMSHDLSSISADYSNIGKTENL